MIDVYFIDYVPKPDEKADPTAKLVSLAVPQKPAATPGSFCS